MRCGSALLQLSVESAVTVDRSGARHLQPVPTTGGRQLNIVLVGLETLRERLAALPLRECLASHSMLLERGGGGTRGGTPRPLSPLRATHAQSLDRRPLKGFCQEVADRGQPLT